MTEVSNEDAMITAGNEAQSLLDNEVFNRTIDGLVQSTFQGFVNSAPENNEEREKIYHHYRALVDIIHTLTQRVAVRDQIIAKNDNDVDETNDNSGDK